MSSLFRSADGLCDAYIAIRWRLVSDFSLTHVDEVIDDLLTKDYSCDVALPRVQKRLIINFFSQTSSLCLQF